MTRPDCSAMRTLQGRVVVSAELGGLIDRSQAEFACELLVTGRDLIGDLTLVHFGVDLPGNQLLVDEVPGSTLKFQIGFGQSDRHLISLWLVVES